MMKFIEDWLSIVTYQPTSKDLAEAAAENAGKIVTASLKRQFLQEEPHTWLRVSSLGKPALYQLANRFLTSQKVISSQTKGTFVDGDLFEGYFWFLAGYMGYECVATQTEETWHGVPGHTDGIIKCPHTGQEWLIELKTMNNRKFQILKETGSMMSLAPEYVTQLAIYQECLGLPAMWVVKNKDTNELVSVLLDEHEAEVSLAKARRLLKGFEKVNTWEQSFDYFMPVPASPTMRAGKVTGYKIPDTMLSCEFRDIIYHVRPTKTSSYYYAPLESPYYRVPSGCEARRDAWIRKHHNHE
jgi:hypothetical protein